MEGKVELNLEDYTQIIEDMKDLEEDIDILKRQVKENELMRTVNVNITYNFFNFLTSQKLELFQLDTEGHILEDHSAEVFSKLEKNLERLMCQINKEMEGKFEGKVLSKKEKRDLLVEIGNYKDSNSNLKLVTLVMGSVLLSLATWKTVMLFI